MTRAIFWDNDGILVDTERLYFTATRQTLERAGITLTQPRYVQLFMVESSGLMQVARESGLTDAERERVREERDALYADLLTRTPLVMPDVDDVLRRLHGHYVMGVVSSAYREHFDLIHSRSGLLPFFDFTLTGEDCAAVKPDPDPYLRAIARSGMDPAHCLAVEDTERGLRAAKAAGVRCAVLPNPLIADGDFRDADAVLSHLGDVMALL
jgi:HAD superfamily hydrolase (TIGR01509 family)